MGLIVVDASVIVDLLAADDIHHRKAARERLTGGDAVFAPAYLDIEVVAALRGLARRSDVLTADAPALLRTCSACRSGASRLSAAPRTGSGSCGRT